MGYAWGKKAAVFEYEKLKDENRRLKKEKLRLHNRLFGYSPWPGYSTHGDMLIHTTAVSHKKNDPI